MRTSVSVRLLVATSCAALMGAGAEAAASPRAQIDAGGATLASPVANQPPAAPSSNSSGGQVTSTAQESQSELGDIVVTATRREESLQKVPVAVSAVTGEQLTRSGITNTHDLTQTMPGLDFSQSNLVMQPTIRGVGTRSNGVGDENSSAVYIDGVYQADPNSAQIELVNIARVEVLRGPQGTLFGRNATGGLVNIITTSPSHVPSGEFKVGVGSFGALEASAYATTGVSQNVAFDISGFAHTDRGYIRDLTTGRKIGERQSYLVRPRLLIEPVDNLTVTFTGSYAHINNPSGIIRSPFNGNTAARALALNPDVLIASEPRTSAQSEPQAADLDTYQGSMDTKLNLGSFTLQNTASYQHTIINNFVIDQDSTPFDAGYVTNNHYGMHYFLDEFRILSNFSGPLNFIAGAFYITGKGFNNNLDVFLSNTTPPIVIKSAQDVESIAGFGEATLRFGDGWKLVGGLRYTSESRAFKGNTTGFGFVLSQIDTKASFGKLTYRAILQKELGRFGNVYASYSTGFKSGVYNPYSTDPTSKAVRPELIKASEIGIKLDPLPWLRVNLSAFNYDYTDIQLQSRDPVSNLVVLSNAAAARMRGGELELTARLAKDLNVRAYGTLLDAKFKSFPNAQVFRPIFQNQTSIGGSAQTPIGNQILFLEEAGKRLVRAPTNTFGGSFDYTKHTTGGAFGLTANVYHTAKYYWDVDNRLFQPAYTTVNGEVSWTLPSDKIRISVWVRNLTDAVIYTQLSSSANGDDVTYEKPRTFGAAVDFKF